MGVLGGQGFSKSKIETWIQNTAFKVRKGVCKETSTVTFESVKYPGWYLNAKSGQELQLVYNSTYTGCEAWNSCFIARREGGSVVLESVLKAGDFIVYDGQKI